MSEEFLRVEGLSKAFGTGSQATVAIDSLSFTLKKGEFLAIVGPSGCGKTTLLRLISGLLQPDAGRVLHRGQAVAGVPPWLSIVFQEYNRSLYPWLSVEQNVRCPLARVPRRQAHERALEALALVGLPETRDRYPWQLSGGMQQRVAIARALAAKPELLLMDEPFGSVDAQTRITLENMLLDLWQRMGLTALLVTHDIEEAIFMADRVVALSARPSRVLEELVVDLPRPRDQLATKALPRFQELRADVYRLLGVDHAGPREAIPSRAAA